MLFGLSNRGIILRRVFTAAELDLILTLRRLNKDEFLLLTLAGLNEKHT
jgi:hypothetical protein